MVPKIDSPRLPVPRREPVAGVRVPSTAKATHNVVSKFSNAAINRIVCGTQAQSSTPLVAELMVLKVRMRHGVYGSEKPPVTHATIRGD